VPRRWPQLPGGPGEAVAVGEEGGQVVGQVGVAGQELLPARRPAGLGGLQVRRDGLVDPLLVLGRLSQGAHTSLPLLQLPA
jgi:hypothetical protein